jgi:hypothetical protein
MFFQVVDDKPDEWDIRDSVPGSPGENYPVYGSIPRTAFRCEGRIPGYYADPETSKGLYEAIFKE